MRRELTLLLTVALTVFATLVFSCGTGKRSNMERLLAEADRQNQAYDSITGVDSLVLATHYYDRHGTINERMRAHYLLGCAYRDMGEAPRALATYQDAADCADTTVLDNDKALLSRIHAQMATLLLFTQLPLEAMDEAKTAEKLAWQSNDTLMAISCKMLQANAYSLLGNNDSVAAISEASSQVQLQCRDTVYALLSMKPAINAYLELGKAKEARLAIDRFESLEKKKEMNVVSLSMKGYDAMKARYYLLLHEYDSAFACIRMAGENVDHPKDQLNIIRELARYYTTKGVPDSALKYTELFVDTDDSLYRTSVRESYAKMHSLYNYERNRRMAEQRGRQVQDLHFRQFVLIILMLAVVMAAYLYIMWKKRKMDAVNRELNGRYAESLAEYDRIRKETIMLRQWQEESEQLVNQLRQEQDKYAETVSKLTDKVSRYQAKVKQNEEDLKKQAHAIAAFQKDKKSPELWNLENGLFNLPVISRLHTSIAKGIQPSDSQLNEVEHIVEEMIPTFVPKIKELYPSINHDNILFCIFTKLRFINSERAVIFNISSQSVTNRCAFLYGKLTEKKGGAGNFEHFIQQIG